MHRAGVSGLADADNFESSPFSAAIMVVSYIHALGMQDSETQYDEFLHKYEIILIIQKKMMHQMRFKII